MIAKLKGLLDSVGQDSLILDVGGVGYLVFCSGRTLSALPAIGEPVALSIETHVREDHIHLFGFATKQEQDWFLLLQSVQGVGAKVALAILTVLGSQDLTNALASKDAKAFARANGVGPKLAGRIVNELKDKVGSLSLSTSSDIEVSNTATPTQSAQGQVFDDAISALANLGYGRSEAFSAIAAVKARHGDDVDLSTLIRDGLKELSP
ncbi:MAG: Holliday junction branch migration protein RuvA [Sphingomonadales bacterium]|jgi:Holliday junction DNA helicase RuvA